MTRKGFLLALLVLAITNIALFWKFYFKDQLPFPGDLLVSFYFPWSSGGFSGFDPWTTRKDVIAMDVIRQIYPWKTLAADLIKQGQLPLWNPYNFSGTPLLANAQSSVFFPGMILFLVLPYIYAWLAHVILLPLLFGLFVYLFLRSLKLSNLAATFGAIAASNISYITVWAEQIVVIQSVLFLPLVLWAIEKFSQTKRTLFILLTPILLALSVFGGHPQTVVYVFILTFAFLLFKKISVRWTVVVLILPLFLSAIQLIPSLELYWYSAREVAASQALFFSSALPWQNLLTTLIPDIFGNPATNNYIGRDYGNFQAYFGITALVLAVIAIYRLFKNSYIKFFGLVALLGLVFSLPPFAFVFSWLKVPILSSGYPSRMVFIFQLAMTFLAAFGFDHLWQKKELISGRFVGVMAALILAVAGLILAVKLHLVGFPVSGNYFLVILLVVTFVTLAIRFPRLHLLLLVAAVFEYSYFFNKYQPFAPAKFVFPLHPTFTFLQNNAGQDRFFGLDRAYVDNNFATYYRVYSPEGYDPLYIKRYEELLAGAQNGTLEKSLPRSDAWIKTQNQKYRDRIFDLLGVRYILDKTDDPVKEWEPDLRRFPKDQYKMVWRVNKWKAFARKSALPRAFLVGNYEVIGDDKMAVEKIYDPAFTPQSKVILATKPSQDINNNVVGQAVINSYTPNRVVIKTSASAAKLLLLSDTFFPGWQATIDGQSTPILQADYAFRGVLVPAGVHVAVFEYQPMSFRVGLIITAFSALIWLVLLIYYGYEKTFRHHSRL